MKRLLKLIFGMIFLALICAVSWKLFYQEEMSNTGRLKETLNYDKDIVIAFDSESRGLEPTFHDMPTRNRLLQIYEPLLMPDRDLNMKPLLLLGYGQTDDLTFVFRLRNDVYFHNGDLLTSGDVSASFDRALSHSESQIKDMLLNMDSFKKLSDTQFQIKLKRIDPLFLNKLSTVLIVPKRYATTESFDPVGTGPYIYVEEKGLDLYLKRNDRYWGDRPVYKNISILTLNTLDSWSAENLQNVDLAFSVPPSASDSLRISKKLISVSDLEVTFLAFNFNSDFFKDIDMRKAFKLAINRRVFPEIFNGFAAPASQFVSKGVYGYNPEVEISDLDVSLAKSYVKTLYSFSRPKIVLDLLKEQEAVGEYLKGQLSDIGIDLELNLLSFEDLQNKIAGRSSDLYLIGFRNEFGDVSDFYSSMVYTNGAYNGSHYSNEVVDKKIEQNDTWKNGAERLSSLKEIMDILVNEDIYGIPLYESGLLYAVSQNTVFEPRIDGYVLIKEIK